MALIKCPQCGQTVLSVASKCPKCSYLLLQAPAPKGDNRGFTHCRRCEKIIPRNAPICEYCGYPQLARRRIRTVLGLVLLAAVVVAGVIGVRRLTSPGEPDPTTSVALTPTIRPTVADTEAARSVPVAPPIDAQPVPVASPPPADPDTSSLPPGAQVRWSREWANVREGPGTDHPVVGVLRPYTEVAVTGLRAGWWLVYIDGTPLGYVARDLLTAAPPSP